MRVLKQRRFVFTHPGGDMCVNFPLVLEDLSPPNLRKIFKLIMESRLCGPTWDEQLPYDISVYIADWVTAYKLSLELAEKHKKKSYIDPESIATTDKVSKAQRKSIKESNKALDRLVDTERKAYERAKKIQSIWLEIRAKYV